MGWASAASSMGCRPYCKAELLACLALVPPSPTLPATACSAASRVVGGYFPVSQTYDDPRRRLALVWLSCPLQLAGNSATSFHFATLDPLSWNCSLMMVAGSADVGLRCDLARQSASWHGSESVHATAESPGCCSDGVDGDEAGAAWRPGVLQSLFHGFLACLAPR